MFESTNPCSCKGRISALYFYFMIASIVVTVLTSCGISGSFEVILSECRQSEAKLPWIGVLFVRLGARVSPKLI
ncbi:hypothetical protein BDV35DRAFT_42514 [Aspergillus flavus]|uniref:Uncharacterized protein n=1 Tax=Aspergillus flavus TaxID=5059 RepID=A0A5N6GLU0_ASPFL|nr:hypothetical protein BDV35DRAFT_42514 [Aspergillus flavus]